MMSTKEARVKELVEVIPITQARAEVEWEEARKKRGAKRDGGD